MFELVQTNRVEAQTLAFVLLALAAWRWGAGPERALAAVLVWLRVADWAYHGLFDSGVRLVQVDFAHALIDLIACAAALFVALHANRLYPLWFAALQFLALFAHLARALAVDIHPIAHGIMFIAPSYFQIVTLGAGLWLHARRVRRHGPYRSWRSSSPRSPVLRPGSWPSA